MAPLPSLEVISIQYNPLSVLEDLAFLARQAPGLKDIHLQGSFISDLPQSVVLAYACDVFPGLEKVNGEVLFPGLSYQGLWEWASTCRELHSCFPRPPQSITVDRRATFKRQGSSRLSLEQPSSPTKRRRRSSMIKGRSLPRIPSRQGSLEGSSISLTARTVGLACGQSCYLQQAVCPRWAG